MSVFASLEGAYPGLPRAQRRIVDCLRGGATTWELLRQEDLARAAGVSVATLIRFVRQQGFGGFPAFREAIRAERVSRRGGQRLLEVSGGPSDLVEQVVRLDQANLQVMLGVLSESLLQGAVDRLGASRQRLLLGRGVSQVMAQMLGYQLGQAGLICAVTGSADFSTQVGSLTSEDLLVLFCFSPYARETVEAAVFAGKWGIPMLGFSDRVDSPLAQLVDLHLLVPCENVLYSHSFAAFSVLSHALASRVAHGDRISSLQRLRAAERVARPLLLEPFV